MKGWNDGNESGQSRQLHSKVYKHKRGSRTRNEESTSVSRVNVLNVWFNNSWVQQVFLREELIHDSRYWVHLDGLNTTVYKVNVKRRTSTLYKDNCSLGRYRDSNSTCIPKVSVHREMHYTLDDLVLTLPMPMILFLVSRKTGYLFCYCICIWEDKWQQTSV
jgi:hypothetical protein